jgi:hypothetical protein
MALWSTTDKFDLAWCWIAAREPVTRREKSY